MNNDFIPIEKLFEKEYGEEAASYILRFHPGSLRLSIQEMSVKDILMIPNATYKMYNRIGTWVRVLGEDVLDKVREARKLYLLNLKNQEWDWIKNINCRDLFPDKLIDPLMKNYRCFTLAEMAEQTPSNRVPNFGEVKAKLLLTYLPKSCPKSLIDLIEISGCVRVVKLYEDYNPKTDIYINFKRVNISFYMPKIAAGRLVAESKSTLEAICEDEQPRKIKCFGGKYLKEIISNLPKDTPINVYRNLYTYAGLKYEEVE